jgi:uncharacterized protein
MFKTSNYNFFVETDDGHLLLYNAKTGAFAAVPLNVKSDIDHLLKSPCERHSADKETLDNLKKGGFLVKAEADEFSEIRKTYENYKNDNKKMILTLLASETCNFNCPYCFIYDRRGFNMKPWVYDAVLKYIEKNAGEHGNIKINWFGGEPTLGHDNIVSFSRRLNDLIAARKFETKVYTMVTNGYLLTKERLKTYAELGINMFQVTLDGNEATHDKTRCLVNGGRTFATIWKNLTDIKSTDCRFDMAIRVNFLKGMEKEIGDLTGKFAETFGKDDRFSIYFRPVYNFETKRDDICAVQDDIYSLEAGVDLQMKYNLQAAEATGTLRTRFLLSNPVPHPIPGWCDTEKKNFWVIGADGLLFKCDSYIGAKEQAVARLTGNGDVEPLEGAYNWNKNIYEDEKNKKCMGCKMLPLCQGGCPRLRKEGGMICYLNEEHIKTALLKTHAFNLKRSADIAK